MLQGPDISMAFLGGGNKEEKEKEDNFDGEVGGVNIQVYTNEICFDSSTLSSLSCSSCFFFVFSDSQIKPKLKKNTISFLQLQMIRLQNHVGHPRWTLHQRILAPAAFRKGDHVAHAGAAQQHRHQPIEAERDARVRRTARTQHLDEMRKLGQPLRGQFEDLAQNV